MVKLLENLCCMLLCFNLWNHAFNDAFLVNYKCSAVNSHKLAAHELFRMIYIECFCHHTLRVSKQPKRKLEFFFKAPTITLDEVLESDKQLRKKLEPTAAKQIIADIIEVLNSSDFSVENLEKLLRNYADSSEHSTGVIFKLIRISVTGQIAAPPLFDTLQTLGKTETLARLNNV